MALTYKALATVTVGAGGAAGITFSNIPAGYTDLSIFLNGRSTYTGDTYRYGTIQFNDSTSDQSSKYSYYDGSTQITSAGDVYYWTPGNSAASNIFSNIHVYISNYSSSATKAVSLDSVSPSNTTQAFIAILAGRWNNTAAINKIAFFPAGGNWVQYSSATLFGISKS